MSCTKLRFLIIILCQYTFRCLGNSKTKKPLTIKLKAYFFAPFQGLEPLRAEPRRTYINAGLQFELYPPVCYKTIQRGIYIFKCGVGYAACINGPEFCLAGIRQVFKVYKQRETLPNFFGHKPCGPIAATCCAIV